MTLSNQSNFPDRIRAGKIAPWVGAGPDGCKRSAAICDDELIGLAADDPRRDDLVAQREAWLDIAARWAERI